MCSSISCSIFSSSSIAPSVPIHPLAPFIHLHLCLHQFLHSFLPSFLHPFSSSIAHTVPLHPFLHSPHCFIHSSSSIALFILLHPLLYPAPFHCSSSTTPSQLFLLFCFFVHYSSCSFICSSTCSFLYIPPYIAFKRCCCAVVLLCRPPSIHLQFIFLHPLLYSFSTFLFNHTQSVIPPLFVPLSIIPAVPSSVPLVVPFCIFHHTFHSNGVVMQTY